MTRVSQQVVTLGILTDLSTSISLAPQWVPCLVVTTVVFPLFRKRHGFYRDIFRDSVDGPPPLSHSTSSFPYYQHVHTIGLLTLMSQY